MAIRRQVYRNPRQRAAVTKRLRYLFWLSGFLFFAATALAGLLPGNIWPNPALEMDGNNDGIPDFWNKGGSNPNIESWTTATNVSPTHAFMLNDSSTTDYGEWYSNLLPITGGTNYLLRFNVRYVIASNGTMRV